MTITIGAGLRNFPYPTGYTGPSRDRNAASQFDTNRSVAIEELKEEAARTPAQRKRDEVLKRHGIDERGYVSLDAERRRALEAEIFEAVSRTVGPCTKSGSTFTRLV